MNFSDTPPDLPSPPPPIIPYPQVPPVEPRRWYQIWWAVWRHPGTASFRSILAEPVTGPGRSFLWIGLTTLLLSLLGSILNAIVLSAARSTAWALVCGVVAAPAFAILGAAISNSIYHGVARLFGGTGKWGHLLFCSTAIQAPEALLGMASYLVYPAIFASHVWGSMSLLATLLLCVSGVFVMIVSLYGVVLYVLGVAAAENLSTGKAVAVVLIPTIVVFILTACIVAAGIAAFWNIHTPTGIQG